MIDEDLGVFFDTGEFARTFTRAAGAPDEISFAAIFSVVDAEALQGYALNAEAELTYPSEAAALRKGDVLTDGGGPGYPAGSQWLVREHPVRVNDGRESRVLLSQNLP